MNGRDQQHGVHCRASDWRTPEWCREAGVHWESWSLNGEVCVVGLDPPIVGGARLASCLTWLMRSFASRCRSTYDATGALAFMYSSPQMPNTLVSTMCVSFDLALHDPRLMSERVRHRGGRRVSCRWPELWLEGSAYEYVIGVDPLPPARTARRKLVLLVEERQVVVPARSTRPAAGVDRAWRKGLAALASLDGGDFAGILFEDELAFAVNILVLVHAQPSEMVRPRPSLTESYRRHAALVDALGPVAQAEGMPVMWHALWRMPPAMTWSTEGGKPWMRYPALSFVTAVRSLCAPR